jgi:exosome complex component RRP41
LVVKNREMDAYNEFTGLREDGRRPGELRRIAAEMSTVSGCTGSAIFKMGQTEVIAQIFGPSEGKAGDRELAEVIVDVQFADFAKSPHPVDVQRSGRSRDSEVIIKRTFEAAIRRELFPSSKINITVTVIQDDGGFQSAAINAVTLSLIDAGIPIHDFVVALTCAYISDMVFLDTGRGESATKFPVLELAIFPGNRQIVSMSLLARIAPDAVKALTDAAIKGCLRLYSVMSSIARSSAAVRCGSVQAL